MCLLLIMSERVTRSACLSLNFSKFSMSFPTTVVEFGGIEVINVLGTEKSLGQTSKNPTYERGFLYRLLISVLSSLEKLQLDRI